MLTLLNIKTYIITISKILGVFFCCYFLYQVKQYEVTWNLFTTIFPGMAKKINGIFSSLGTYILIIPLTIIIASLLMPESKFLHYTSACFGIGSTLFSLCSGLFYDTLGKLYNLRIVVVSKILSLDEKREIFLTEYHKIIQEKYIKMTDFYNKLLEQVEPKYFEIYDEKFNSLQTILDVRNFANLLVKEYAIRFATLMPQEKITFFNANSISLGIKIIAVVGGVCLILFLVNIATTDYSTPKRIIENLTENVSLVKTLANSAKESNQTTQSLATIVSESCTMLADICDGFNGKLHTVATDVVNNVNKQNMLNMQNSDAFSSLNDMVKKLATKVEQLELNRKI